MSPGTQPDTADGVQREMLSPMSEQHPGLNAPEQIAEEFARAWNAADAAALAALFAEDADFVNVVGLWWEDRDSIRAAHDYGFHRIFPDSHMQVSGVKVRRLGEQAAMVHTRWRLSGQSLHSTQDGATSGTRGGVFSFVLQVQHDGGWLAVSAHNTDRVPGTETYALAEDERSGGAGPRPVSYQRTSNNRDPGASGEVRPAT